MDIAPGLDVALLRRHAAHAEHAAELRAARERKDARTSAVEFGESVTQTQAPDAVAQADPAATYDRTHEREDPPHLVDIQV